MKILSLLTFVLFASVSYGSSLTVKDLCVDYLKISQSSDSYKGKQEYLNSCLAIKEDMDKSDILKNKIVAYLKNNSTIHVNIANESKVFVTSIIDQSSIDCKKASDGTFYCIADVSDKSKVCELDFTKFEFDFNEDASNITSISGYEAPSCVSW